MKTSVKGIARKALSEDKKMRKERDAKYSKVADSLQNFAAGLGLGTDNISSSGTYGFNPITRVRTLLEWIHRGTWIGGVAVDIVAEDMTRAGVDLTGDIEPDQILKIEEVATALNIWGELCDGIRWSRLYGGAVVVLLIDGQDYSTPFRLETVGKGQFRGLYTIDRWGLQPSLENLVKEEGPHLGLPKFYQVTNEAPGLRGQKIHYTRVIRLEGIRLPFWQRVMENLWGISEIERLYDRMIAFDSATTGASQLVFKSFLRTYKIEQLRELIAAGGEGLQGLIAFVNFMRQTQTTEGITLIDAKDDLSVIGFSGFSGLSDVILQIGQQLSGSLQIPLVRLFGQSPAGLNSTGESDLRTYYDGIAQRQNRHKSSVTTVYRCIAQSEGVKLPSGFGVSFRPLWQMTPEQKADVAQKNVGTIKIIQDMGLTSDQFILREIKQQSNVSGIGTNLKREDIDAASDVPAPRVDPLLPNREGEEQDPGDEEKSRQQRIHLVKDSDKISQARANYVEKSHKKTHCGDCHHFGGEGFCAVMKSKPLKILDAGGCDLFVRRSTADEWNEEDHPRVQSGERGGEFTSGGGGGGSEGGSSSGGGASLEIEPSPTDWLIRQQISPLSESHVSGLKKIHFREHDFIRTMSAASGKVVEAYGVYDPASQEMTLSSNKDNIGVIGGGTVLHEMGHHVHLARMTDAAAKEWEEISGNGEHALISAYARSNRGEHFAEAYRAYSKGEHERKRLKNLEPRAYKFMAALFRKDSKMLLPPGQRPSGDWMNRYKS